MAEHKNLEWRCTTCGATEAPTGTGYGSLLKHSCSGKIKLALVDKDTGEVLATSLKQAVKLGFVEKQQPKTRGAPSIPGPPLMGAKGDEHIKEHYQGYSKDNESFLFVIHPDGRIRDLRLEHPLLYPIFQLMQKERGYGGDFPQFIADAVETLFANAGYELALVPKSQSYVYGEMMRLLKEGKLELVNEEDKVTLEVRNGNKDGRAAGQDLPECEESIGSESTKQGDGEEEPGEPQ